MEDGKQAKQLYLIKTQTRILFRPLSGRNKILGF